MTKMRNISKEQLAEILEKHVKWLHLEENGERANLSYASLPNVDLQGTNLAYADLNHANLAYADLSDTNLRFANLTGSNLHRTDLRHSDLTGAVLTRAVLSATNMEGANLVHTKLSKKEQIRFGTILKKDLIGYKVAKRNTIVELCIPKGSIVYSINNNKCRTNRAKVISITCADNPNEHFNEATSLYSSHFVYKVGKKLEIKDFNLMYNIECAKGIHFFRTREEAVSYWSNYVYLKKL